MRRRLPRQRLERISTAHTAVRGTLLEPKFAINAGVIWLEESSERPAVWLVLTKLVR